MILNLLRLLVLTNTDKTIIRITHIYKQKLFYLVFLMLGVTNICAQQGVVNEINYTGNKKTKAVFLDRIIKVKKGKAIDSLQIINDIERIKRLDGVAFATYTVEKMGNDYNVTYNLTENFSIIPGLRIGQANDDSFSFRVSVFEFNGLGRNIIAGGFYQREVFNSFGLFLEHPYLFTNKLGLGINYQDITTQQPIYSGDQQTDYNYTLRGPELTLFYEHNFNNRFELGFRAFEERYVTIEEEMQNIIPINAPEPELNSQVVRASYEYIDLDLEFHNLSGVRNFFDANYFLKNEGLLQTEYILNNTTQYFTRIGKRGNWANQLQLQYSNPVDNTNFVPITIDNQLNTRGAGNTIDRGTASFAVNTEYRYSLIEKNWFVLQGNAFVDISGIQRPGNDLNDIFSEDRFRVYPGVGFRLIHKRIFNAVIRFDYGFNVTGDGENGVVFGIGQYF
ncbi:outer membrane protein assembly factor [Aquimarina sp. ERC-38]|uniref:POTRA domain-containing protein n=1 Tax=Aquimarina sp. ERC-38 TaxID=2949996 RepID=UPI002245020C|nr:POTRA domain-containing protein [Aquimarina sp. ERC-38]UZO82319.1 outer membrane protein assembly factor [Aquimarina sp. ERC-38]